MGQHLIGCVSVLLGFGPPSHLVEIELRHRPAIVFFFGKLRRGEVAENFPLRVAQLGSLGQFAENSPDCGIDRYDSHDNPPLADIDFTAIPGRVRYVKTGQKGNGRSKAKLQSTP
jgi:hypothetical protein